MPDGYTAFKSMIAQSNTELEESMPMQMHSHRYLAPPPNPRPSTMNKELYYRIISYLGQREMPKHLEEWTTIIIN